MISLRREHDGTLRFQLADTVLAGIPEDEFTEEDVRTMSGDIHNIVLAMCMQTRLGWRPIQQFFVPLDGNGEPNALSKQARCHIMCEIMFENGPGDLPTALWDAVAMLETRGAALNMQFAPFFASPLFAMSMVLKWLGGRGYLRRYWDTLGGDTDQFVRDMCYFAHVQFDQFMHRRLTPEQTARHEQLWSTVSAQYDGACTSVAPFDVYMMMEDLIEEAAQARPKRGPGEKPDEDADDDDGKTSRKRPSGPDGTVTDEDVLVTMYGRKRFRREVLSTLVTSPTLDLYLRFIATIDAAVAVSCVMSGGEYARPAGSRLPEKISNVLISIPYLMHNDCTHLLLVHTKRFRRLLYFFPNVNAASVAGMCFYAQFLTETQMDMYLADLSAHVAARTTPRACEVLRRHLADKPQPAPLAPAHSYRSRQAKSDGDSETRTARSNESKRMRLALLIDQVSRFV